MTLRRGPGWLAGHTRRKGAQSHLGLLCLRLENFTNVLLHAVNESLEGEKSKELTVSAKKKGPSKTIGT